MRETEKRHWGRGSPCSPSSPDDVALCEFSRSLSSVWNTPLAFCMDTAVHGRLARGPVAVTSLQR